MSETAATAAADRRRLWIVVGVLAITHLIGVVCSWASVNHFPRGPGAWVDAGTGFLLLTTVWRGGLLPTQWRPVAYVAAGVVISTFALHVLLGDPVGTSAWISLGSLVKAVAVLLVYRALLGQRADGEHPHWGHAAWVQSWVPRNTVDLMMVMIATAAGATITVLWGIVPPMQFGEAAPAELGRFFLNYALTGFVGCSSLLVMLQAPAPHLRERRLGLLVVLSLMSVAALATALVSMGLPVSWIVIVPSLLAGTLLRPWAAAAQGLVTASAATAIANSSLYLDSPQAGPLTEITLEALIGGSVLIALTMSLLHAERQELMAQLRDERTEAAKQAEMFRTVMAGMTDGVLISGMGSELKYRNAATEELLGIDLENWDLSTWPEFMTVITQSGKVIRDMGSIREVWSGKPDPISQIQIGAPGDDSVQTIDVAYRTMFHDDEKQMVMILHDITEQLEREAVMRGFAAVAAHDLRRPLTALAGWVAMALDGAEPGSQQERFLQKATAGSERLETIIDDWLQFSVVRDGQITPQWLRLDPLVHDVAEGLVAPDPDGSEGPFSWSVDPLLEVEADPPLLRQVLSNLLANGLKYHASGVDPVVRVEARDHAPGWVRVDVIDNGIGIPLGEEKLIFDMFHRARDVTETYAGSGIGLAVVKDIVTRHGGRVWAIRNPGGGSTFSFTLPGRHADR